jgi:endonuclease/exonuclease/phosphatase family metal-dependent hydrolase
LRIATFNLENLSDEPLGHEVSVERHAILRRQLERLDADVVCLQEVDAQLETASGRRFLRALDDLLANIPYRDFYRASIFGSQTGAPRDKHNLVVLSRWPIQSIAQYANTLVPAPRYRCITAEPQESERAVIWARPILHAGITLPHGPTLHFINMHLKASLASFIPCQKVGPFAWKSVLGRGLLSGGDEACGIGVQSAHGRRPHF